MISPFQVPPPTPLDCNCVCCCGGDCCCALITIKLAATIMTAISVVVNVRAIAGEIDDREDVFMMLGKKNMFYE
jgi:hypothetical protein